MVGMVSPSEEGRLSRREGRFFSPLGEENGRDKFLPIMGRIKVGEGKRGLFPLRGRGEGVWHLG